MLSTSQLEERTRSRESITLESLEAMTHAIEYDGLKEAISGAEQG